ncbi:MAG: hypothetical protein MJ197_03640 [Bacteroidales bacterium]|nr:hypothetical protein [Bacteroidales bacterium]
MTRKRKVPLTPIFVKGDSDLMILLSIDDKRTLTRWRKDGLPYCKDNGIYLYDIAEVREWIHDYCEKNPNTEAFYSDEENKANCIATSEPQIEEFIPHVDLSKTRFKRVKAS